MFTRQEEVSKWDKYMWTSRRDFRLNQQHLRYRGWLTRADRMNTVLLITVMFTLASVRGRNQSPCLKNSDSDAYDKFVGRHILQEPFNRTSQTEWRRYLIKYQLCNRGHQKDGLSFIRKRDQPLVVQICNGSGRPLFNSYQGNLCIGDSTMLVYSIEVSDDGDCKIIKLEKRPTFVIVACDIIENRCRPVQFEPYGNQSPDTRARLCGPHASGLQTRYWPEI